MPTGKVLSVGPLEPVLAAEGVVQADTYLQVGETIRPVRLDGDRRGYVIATADTSVEALQRAEAAARLLEVEVRRELRVRPRPLRRADRGAKEGGYRFAFFEGEPRARGP